MTDEPKPSITEGTMIQLEPEPRVPTPFEYVTGKPEFVGDIPVRVDIPVEPRKVWKYQGSPVYQIPDKLPRSREAWDAFFEDQANMVALLQVGTEVFVQGEGGTIVRMPVRSLFHFELSPLDA